MIFFAALVACGEKSELKPAIDSEKFVGVLTDVRILEGYYSVRYERVDSSRGKINAYYNEVFARHGITKEQFESTMNYYASHPNEMTAIEEQVADSLSALIAEDRKKHFTPKEETAPDTTSGK